MKLVSLAVICMLGACGVALAQSFAPARLVGLQGRDDLRCPTVDRQSPVLFCQVVIDAQGKARDDQSTHCFGNLANDLTRARDLRGKILKSEFAPAQIDGEPVEVYASFRVSFSPNGKACEISVYPNFGTQQDEFGLDYFAPQEIYTHGGWLGTVPESEQRWLERPARGIAFSMSVAVDDRGHASDGRVEGNNFAPVETVNRAVKALETSRFVPLFVNGAPRPGRYFEFMYLPPLDTRPRLR
jgi:hypothetical protein